MTFQFFSSFASFIESSLYPSSFSTSMIFAITLSCFFKKLKKQDKVIAKIIEVENEDGYIELSMKEAKEEKNWKVMEEDKKSQNSLEVEITDANKGGLMARIGDLEGFLPVSQLAPANYPRVEGGDKNKILNELRKFIGKKMRVQILDANSKDEKLIFSEKAAENESIQSALKKY